MKHIVLAIILILQGCKMHNNKFSIVPSVPKTVSDTNITDESPTLTHLATLNESYRKVSGALHNEVFMLAEINETMIGGVYYNYLSGSFDATMLDTPKTITITDKKTDFILTALAYSVDDVLKIIYIKDIKINGVDVTSADALLYGNTTQGDYTWSLSSVNITSSYIVDLSGIPFQNNNKLWTVIGSSKAFCKNNIYKVGDVVYVYNNSELEFYEVVKDTSLDAYKKHIYTGKENFTVVKEDTPNNITTTTTYYPVNEQYMNNSIKWSCIIHTKIDYHNGQDPYRETNIIEDITSFKPDNGQFGIVQGDSSGGGVYLMYGGDNKMYFIIKEENQDFFQNADVIESPNILDKMFYKKINYGLNDPHSLNQHRLVDDALNTRTKVKKDDWTILDITCRFDFIALRNTNISSATIEILGDDGEVKEILADSLTGRLLDYNSCGDCQHTICLPTYFQDVGISLDKAYNMAPSSHKIKITYNSDGEIGDVFVGLKKILPCIKANISQGSNDYVKVETNEISNIKTFNKDELSRKETHITYFMEKISDINMWYPYFENLRKNLVYFHVETKDNDDYAFLSHGGFIEELANNAREREISHTLVEFNNA
jgi:hypothetical protein